MPATVARLEGKIPIESCYTSGLAGERTLRALKEKGVFVGTFCSSCQVTYFPARTFCERCFERILENEKKVGLEGTLEAFSRVSVDQSGKKTKPYYVGLIKLDGADTLLLHRLKAPQAQTNLAGARVRALLAKKRRGSITDILAFEILP